MSSPIDKLIGKIGEKAFGALAAALGAAIMTLIAAIERWFAKRKAYSQGRQDERELWKAQEAEWKRKVEEIKQSNLSLWEKLKEIKRLRKEFEEYKKIINNRYWHMIKNIFKNFTSVALRSILATILLLGCCVSASAKGEKTIKFDNFLSYQGECDKKIPNGEGKLSFFFTKYTQPVVISGTFKDNVVSNGQFKTRSGIDFNFDSMTYSFNKSNHTISFTFYGITNIKGCNGKGKSKIPHTLSYKLTGYDWKICNDFNIRIEIAEKMSSYDMVKEIVIPTDVSYESLHSLTGKSYQSSDFRIEYPRVNEYYFNKAISGFNGNATINGNIKLTGYQDNWTASTSYGTVKGDTYNHKYSAAIRAKDGSKCQMDYDGHRWNGTITYADGSSFNGEASTLLSVTKPQNYGADLLAIQPATIEAKLYQGNLTKKNGKVVTYSYGESSEKDMFNSLYNAFPVTEKQGHAYFWHRSWDDFSIEDEDAYVWDLFHKSPVGYFRKHDLNSDLKKKVWLSSDDYKNNYEKRFNTEHQHLLNDQYYFVDPISRYGTFSVRYDVDQERFVLSKEERKYKKINEGVSDFHFGVGDNLRLTYPRSLVSLTTDNSDPNYDPTYYVSAITCKVSPDDALKGENNECSLVWVFKLSDFKSEAYGKTTHLYIVNNKSGEIYADLTPGLSSSQASFRSSEYKKPTVKKRTYHERGRLEQCPDCMGSGRIGYWDMGTKHYRQCSNCAGSGKVVEHYW